MPSSALYASTARSICSSNSGAGHDLDVPAAKLAGESAHFVRDDRSPAKADLLAPSTIARPIMSQSRTCSTSAGCKRVGDQYLWVVAIANDVNVFPSQLFADSFDSAASVADTHCDRIDLAVLAADRDLTAVARFARNRIDVDHTPSFNSGISCSNNRCTSCGRVRLRTTRTRLPVALTSKTTARTRSLA